MILSDELVVKAVDFWAQAQGFEPCNNFDPQDPSCLRDYGYHRVWTVEAKLPLSKACSLDFETLCADFSGYLKSCLPHGGCKLELYSFEHYEHINMGEIHLYISVTTV